MVNQGIAISISGDDSGVQAMLEAVDTALNPVAIVSFLGGVVQPWIRKRASERFTQEGDDVSGAWAPLEVTTQQIRESLGFPGAHPINRRTGELEAFMTENQGILSSSGIEASLTYPGGEPTGELRNKVKVAQSGGQQPGYRPTPPRPVIGLGEQDLAFVLLALTEHVATAARSKGVKQL